MVKQREQGSVARSCFEERHAGSSFRGHFGKPRERVHRYLVDHIIHVMSKYFESPADVARLAGERPSTRTLGLGRHFWGRPQGFACGGSLALRGKALAGERCPFRF